MDAIVIRNSRWRHILFLILALGFVCTGIFLVINAESRSQAMTGWMSIIFFGSGVPLFIVRMFDSRPRLVIDEHGINDRTLKVGTIPWSEITGAYVKSISGNDFICLQVRNPQIWTANLSPTRKALLNANQALGFSTLNINLSGLRAQTLEIHELILKKSAAAGAAQGQ